MNTPPVNPSPEAGHAPLLMDAAAIRAILPHQGPMCVLDAVLDCDAQSIRCRAVGHRDPASPMRRAGGLGAACGIEYAAQAMALHAASVASQVPGARPGTPLPQGRLASVREVTLHADRLDDADHDLTVTATLLSGDPSTALYAFALRAGERLLLDGRASVLIRPAATGGAAAGATD